MKLRGDFMGLIDTFKKAFVTSTAQKEAERHSDTDVNRIAPKCSSCGAVIPNAKTKCFSCEWAEDKFSNNKEIFNMITKDGHEHNFIYLGQSRCVGGPTSEEWCYLCKENDIYYLLRFSDSVEGIGWSFTKLLQVDYEKLVSEDARFWFSIAWSKERKRIFGVRLKNMGDIRWLLPTKSSRNKFTDSDFLR